MSYPLVQGIIQEFASVFAGGVLPKVLPENPVLPAMTYQMISSPNKDVTQSGPSGLVMNERWQFTIWAKDYDTVVQLADIVYARVHARRKNWGAVEAVTQMDDERDDRDAETGLERRDIDVFFSYSR